MNDDHDDQPGNTRIPKPGPGTGSLDPEHRREPLFSGFDEGEEPFEEPDRDTDTAYHEHDEEPFDDLFEDEGAPDDDLLEEDEVAPAREELEPEPPLLAGEDEDIEDFSSREPGADEEQWQEPDFAEPELVFEPESPEDEDWDEAESSTAVVAEPDYEEPAEEPQRWMQEEAYAEDGEGSGQPWPLGLIIVAAVALVLLVAGGYGVMQQRAETQDEIRQLRAELATTATTEDVNASRAALQEMRARNDQLKATTESMAAENRRLLDTVAGLEQQLQAQQETLAKAEAVAKQAPPAAPKPAAKPSPKPAPTGASTPAANGSWFVNFGSYGQRPVAESWAGKLKPAAGSVIIATGEKNGKTFYRVRVVGLSTRDSAQRVARALEVDHGLSKLWIGQQ